MRNESGECHEGQPHHRAEGADEQAAPLEPGLRVDARAELIDVGQSGPGDCGRRQAGALEGPGLEACPAVSASETPISSWVVLRTDAKVALAPAGLSNLKRFCERLRRLKGGGSRPTGNRR
jgi:hypothetical protein